MQILVTGSSGLLGSAILFHPFPKTWKMYGTYLNSKIETPQTPCFKVDLSNQKDAHFLLNKIKPDLIVHTAAAVNVDECEVNRSLAHKLNFEMTSHLVNWCGENERFLIQVSTDAFFEGPVGKKFKEEDSPTPMNYYGETKLLAEKLIQENLKKYLILRTNFYGWNYQAKTNTAEWILNLLRQNKKVPCFRDVFYTPLLTHTFAAIAEKFIQKELTGIFNLVGDESISKLDFGKKLCQAFQLDLNLIESVSVENHAFKARRSKNMSLDNSKMKSALNLKNQSFGVLEDLNRFYEQERSGEKNRMKSIFKTLNSMGHSL